MKDSSDTAELKRFADSFQTYSPEAQVALLAAFRDRREATARPAALAAMESDDISLRVAALRALATIGTAAEVPRLARHAAGEGEEKPIARAALASVPGEDVDAAILAMLPAGSPEVCVELLNALAARGAKGAGQSVSARLTDPSELVRTAALKTLGELGGAGQAPPVIALLKESANDSVREQAQSTLNAIAGRAGTECVDNILEGLEGANTESRIALLRILGTAGGPKALAVVCANLTQTDARVKDTAFRVLADWSSVDATPELLQLARTSPEPGWRVLAFRGFVRLCREGDAPAEARMRLLTEAMKSARDLDEKRLVIAALGEQQDLKVLPMLSACFDDPGLAQEACLALVTVAASADPKEKNEVVPPMKQVLKLSASQDVREKARTILERLGEKPQ